MARLSLTERERAGVAFRLAGVNVSDTPTRRKLDRVWDALKVDAVAPEHMQGLNVAGFAFPTLATTYELTSEQRDHLIEWLEPTERQPMTGFMGRVLGPVYDRLKDSRDGAPLASVPPTTTDQETA